MRRLIYKSRCTENITWETMREILNTSEKNNENSEITGALLASKTHFLQVLEGDFEAVNKTFFAIARDNRHTDIELISFDAIDCRLFSHWGMKGIGAFDFNTELSEKLKQKYGEEEGGIRFPVTEWKALALLFDIEMMDE